MTRAAAVSNGRAMDSVRLQGGILIYDELIKGHLDVWPLVDGHSTSTFVIDREASVFDTTDS